MPTAAYRRTLYFIPAGPDKLNNQLFDSELAVLGTEFKAQAEEKELRLQTIDRWSPAAHRKEDVLVVWNHPDQGWLMRALYALKYLGRRTKKFAVTRAELYQALHTFTQKILVLSEPPVGLPYQYHKRKQLASLYTKIFSVVDFKESGFEHVLMPYSFKDKRQRFFNVSKEKFLVMINSNARPHGFWREERYSERLRAVRHFSAAPDFDLYGGRWDKPPFFPYWGYAADMRRNWRGEIPGGVADKLPILAKYKFSLCLENSVFPGYVDGRLVDCSIAGVVPIYLGAPDVTRYVPANCFIDLRNFKSYAELEKYLRAMPESEREAYRARGLNYFTTGRGAELFSQRTFAEKLLNNL